MVLSYLALRKVIGFLGILMPVTLIVGNCILDNCAGLQSSISHYYYTIMGSYFVGTLCAVSLFLFTYKCYNSKQDRITAVVAALFALVVAFFPADSDPAAPCRYVNLVGAKSVSSVHYTAASFLFGSFAYFSLFLFTKTAHPGHETKQKKIRNAVYRICGILILVSMVLIGIYHFVDDLQTKLASYKPVLILESIALIAFGTSWIVKSEAVLKDR
jgi:uncharacterized membrane protein